MAEGHRVAVTRHDDVDEHHTADAQIAQFGQAGEQGILRRSAVEKVQGNQRGREHRGLLWWQR
ncbi:hypothetical protein D3C72_2542680 [compost metagenome]